MAVTIRCSICGNVGKLYFLDSGNVSFCENHAKTKGIYAKCDRFAEEILKPKTFYWSFGICRECYDKQDF